MKTYTTEQLKILAEIRAQGLDDWYDSVHTSERSSFLEATNIFFEWVERMERKGRIDYLLQFKWYKMKTTGQIILISPDSPLYATTNPGSTSEV